MSSLVADPRLGRLRLSQVHIDALLRVLGSPLVPVDGSPAETAAHAELIDAGVIDASGQPQPAYFPQAVPLADPMMMGSVLLQGPGGDNGHQVWVAPEGGVAAAHVRDGWYELIPFNADGTASAVARLSRLSPRDPAGDPIRGTVHLGVPRETPSTDSLGPWTGDDLVAALGAWPAVARAVAERRWRYVRWSTVWSPTLFPDPSMADASAQSALLIETGPAYLWATPTVGDEATLEVVTPTGVWQQLVALVRPPMLPPA